MAEAAPTGWNVHLYPSTLEHESRMDRICREIDAFDRFAAVCQVGVAAEGLPDEEAVAGRVRRLRIAGRQRQARGVRAKVASALGWTWRVFARLRRERVTMVNAHSLATLPLAVVLKWWHRAILVYDTHELETETIAARGLRRPLLKLLERLLIGRCDAVIVVGPGIADWYARSYGIARPAVVRNVPDRRTAPAAAPSAVLRAHFGIPGDEMVFLYQGVVGPGRHVEDFLAAFRARPAGKHLVVMGFGPWADRVREEAATNPHVHYLSAVAPSDVLAHTAGADVGLCGVENRCLSYYLSLPNKLFEFLAAGVPALVPAFPEMRRIVEEEQCGWVLEHDGDWAAAIARLDPGTVRAMRGGAVSAGTRHVWDREREVLHGLYGRLLGGRPAGASAA